MTAIDPSMIQAYLETEFIAHVQSHVVLKIGACNSALDALHEAHGVNCSAFITACNPFSRALSERENEQRQLAFAEDLRRQGLRFLPGVGQHPSGQWPGEPSYLVLGLPLERAKAIACRLEQNAIVWSDFDAKPQLILLR